MSRRAFSASLAEVLSDLSTNYKQRIINAKLEQISLRKKKSGEMKKICKYLILV